jgi:putative copper resistance protein D
MSLFAAMVCLAGINRQYLLPGLFGESGKDRGTRSAQWLVCSAVLELILGVGVIFVVGILGIMAPANNLHSHLH